MLGCQVGAPCFTNQEAEHDRDIKAEEFPKDYKMKLARAVGSVRRMKWVVINDLTDNSLDVT